jgi:hypothetical protein
MLVHSWARVNQQISVHYPLDAHYDSVVDGTSTELISSFTVVTKCCKKYSLPQEELAHFFGFFGGCTSFGLPFCLHCNASCPLLLLDFFPHIRYR